MVNLDDLLLKCYVAEQLEIEGLRLISFEELHPILDELQDLRIKCRSLQSQIDKYDALATITNIDEFRTRSALESKVSLAVV